jgi:alanine dehydrogenase
MRALIAQVERGVIAAGRAGGDLESLAIAAVSAVASRFLAVGTPRSIGLVGCGPRAQDHLDAHRALYAPREVRCADLDGAAADALAATNGGRATSIAEACACDVVCVSRADVTIERAWIRGGTHLNAVGATLDAALLADAKVVTADLAAEAYMWGTLREVVAGLKDGRELDEITIFLASSVTPVLAAVAASVLEESWR